jgi:hypothetical protein
MPDSGEVWLHRFDAELNALGSLAGENTYVVGVDVKVAEQRVEVVIAADATPDELRHVNAAVHRLGSPLNVSLRSSRHSPEEIREAEKYVLSGAWIPPGVRPAGPMSVGYNPKSDCIDVHLSSSAAAVADDLERRYRGLVCVTPDDGMGRC